MMRYDIFVIFYYLKSNQSFLRVNCYMDRTNYFKFYIQLNEY
jgi:hypothetical protein